VRRRYDDYGVFRGARPASTRGARSGPVAVGPADDGAPAYDAFWQGQALDKLVAQRPSQVPTMWLQACGPEDMWGAIHCYLALKAKGTGGSQLPGDGAVAAQPGQLRRL